MTNKRRQPVTAGRSGWRCPFLALFSFVCVGGALAGVFYTYDAQQRLASVTLDNGAQVTYAYDASGNRTGRTYVPPVLGDLDGDRDVDMVDFNLFAGAMAGPDVSTPPPGCESKHFTRADVNDDGDVDLGDFAAFQLAFTGSGG